MYLDGSRERRCLQFLVDSLRLNTLFHMRLRPSELNGAINMTPVHITFSGAVQSPQDKNSASSDQVELLSVTEQNNPDKQIDEGQYFIK